MNYFVTVDGLEVASNLTKIQAINTANKKYEETKIKHPREIRGRSSFLNS